MCGGGIWNLPFCFPFARLFTLKELRPLINGTWGGFLLPFIQPFPFLHVAAYICQYFYSVSDPHSVEYSGTDSKPGSRKTEMAPQKGKKTCFELDIFSGTWKSFMQAQKEKSEICSIFSNKNWIFFRLHIIFCHQKTRTRIRIQWAR